MSAGARGLRVLVKDRLSLQTKSEKTGMKEASKRQVSRGIEAS